MKYAARAFCYSWSQGMLALLLLLSSIGAAETEMNEEQRPIVEITAFSLPAQASLPEGWRIMSENAASSIPVQSADAAQSSTESGAWRLPQGERAIVIASPDYPISAHCRSAVGVALGRGTARADIALEWLVNGQPTAAIAFRPAPPLPDGRQRYNLSETDRPESANALRISITAPPGDASIFLETLRIEGAFINTPEITLLVNQVGYELVEPKVFVVRANFLASNAVFLLLDQNGNAVHEGALSTGMEIYGANGGAWPDYYYRGDFSGFDQEGAYVLQAALDDHPPVRTQTRIAFNLLWEAAFAAAVQPLQARRSTAEIGADKPLFWTEPGTTASQNARWLWDIVYAWSILRGRFQLHPAFTPLDAEVRFAMDRLLTWLSRRESPDQVLDNDMLWYAAALACFSRYTADAEQPLQHARALAEALMSKQHKGVWVFSVVMDLFEKTQEARYIEYARLVFPGIQLERTEPLLSYESETGDHITPALAGAFAKSVEGMLKASDNPFGLPQLIRHDRASFFNMLSDESDLGSRHNSDLLETAEKMALAFRYTANPDYKIFIFDQFNWLLGVNPFGQCMVRGLCRPQDASGDTASPGFGEVLNGIGACGPDKDHPCFMDSPQYSGHALENNFRYLRALALLKRIPSTKPKG